MPSPGQRSTSLRSHQALIALLAALVLGVLMPSRAWPQGTTDVQPASQAASEASLIWRPTLAITGIGYDSNIFNEATAPKGDFVVTLAGGIQPVWHVNEATVSGDATLAYRYFHEYEQERGLDGRTRGELALPVSRVRLLATGSYLNVHERLNYEVDQRARRAEYAFGGGAEIRLGGQTSVTARMDQSAIRFDEGASVLATPLNRRTGTATVIIQHDLTPLTTVVVSGDYSRNHFDTATERDGHETSIVAGTVFRSGALVEGRWGLGWQQSELSDPDVPTYSGLTGDADLWIVLGAATRLGIRSRRDLTFSTDVASPYYVETSVGPSIVVAFADRWDVEGRASRVWLDYQPADLTMSAATSNERVTVVGTSLGFRLTGSTRLGVGVEWVSRRAEADASRSYETLRIVTALSQPLGFWP